MKPGETEWTDALIARLSSLWGDGHTAAEIGRRLHISKNAVVGKVHRLGFPKRQSPIIRTGSPKPAATIHQESDRAVKAIIPLQRAEETPKLVKRPPMGSCDWIGGDKPNWLYCDQPKAKGSYCVQHAMECYAGKAA